MRIDKWFYRCCYIAIIVIMIRRILYKVLNKFTNEPTIASVGDASDWLAHDGSKFEGIMMYFDDMPSNQKRRCVCLLKSESHDDIHAALNELNNMLSITWCEYYNAQVTIATGIKPNVPITSIYKILQTYPLPK